MRIALFLLVLIGQPFISGQSLAQSARPYPSLMETLNKEALASDPAGIRGYSEHLVRLLPIGAAGPACVNSFSGRLAKAEESARQGKRKLISEEVIAEAFNDLMRQTAAPSSFKADVAEVEKARRGFEDELPTIITESKNGRYCSPGEAIWVLGMLIENVGGHPPLVPHSGSQVSGYMPPVRQHLMQFFYVHSLNESADVLDKFAKKLGI
jgi:hypothetical protein